MTALAWFAAGALVGGLAVWWLLRDVRKHLTGELAYYRKQLEVAQDRLVHAWREDKAIIPPRPMEIRAPQPLPTELQEEIMNWESPETRAALETKIRSLYFDRGLGVMAVLKALENDHP